RHRTTTPAFWQRQSGLCPLRSWLPSRDERQRRSWSEGSQELGGCLSALSFVPPVAPPPFGLGSPCDRIPSGRACRSCRQRLEPPQQEPCDQLKSDALPGVLLGRVALRLTR